MYVEKRENISVLPTSLVERNLCQNLIHRTHDNEITVSRLLFTSVLYFSYLLGWSFWEHKTPHTRLSYAFYTWNPVNTQVSSNIKLEAENQYRVLKLLNLNASNRTLFTLLCPPLKKVGHIVLHMSVGLYVRISVSLNLVQLITQECFAPEASNLVDR